MTKIGSWNIAVQHLVAMKRPYENASKIPKVRNGS